MDLPAVGEQSSVIPTIDSIEASRSRIIASLPSKGLTLDATAKHIRLDLVPAFSKSSVSPNYYGFVTGGATPAATYADHIGVDADQNVQVHLPTETIATDVEDAALRMLSQLLQLDPSQWPHRTFTTGATASNILGLACGRQHVLAARNIGASPNVAEVGIVKAMQAAGLDDIQILTTVPHSSLKKAASVVGIGRASVIDVSRADQPHRFDFSLLEDYLQKAGIAYIVAVSCAEVNTGFFATSGEDVLKLREICDRYRAWLHVDAAFGALARALPSTEEFQYIRSGVANLELADSITGDAHKLINVPYDCGFFFSKSLEQAIEVFQNSNAAYLGSAAVSSIPSPLHIGLENSRRFRALPVYATLVAYGREGYVEMIQRQVRLARVIAEFISTHSGYTLLPKISASDGMRRIFIIVLFRAVDRTINQNLVQRINATREIYVSGTTWDGEPAARFAVANWQVDVERDIKVIQNVLVGVSK